MGSRFLALLPVLWATVATATPLPRAAVDTFIDRMVATHHLDRRALEELFAGAELLQPVLDAMARPAERKPWYAYRPIFITERRITGGVTYWNRHASLLARAERRHGVPAAVVTAILGVETFYGARQGRYRVLDALATLAFAWPPRAPFFRRELEQFLLLTQEQGLDPRAVRGSYAGAMGAAQFIPSSYRAYAEDFDGDGRVDLWHQDADAIGSVAAYLARHGWERGGAVAVPARVARPDAAEPFVQAGLEPRFTAAELAAAGIEPARPVPDGARLALVRLAQADGPAYWLAMNNFYVITRYNRSPLYAMAVHQLARAIAERHADAQAGR